MDPVTVIMTGLAAGAGEVLKDGVKHSVIDAYRSLRDRVRELLGDDDDAQRALVAYEEAPDEWKDQLSGKLAESGADGDPEVISAADVLLSLLENAPMQSSRDNIAITDSQITIGNHNHVINVNGGSGIR